MSDSLSLPCVFFPSASEAVVRLFHSFLAIQRSSLWPWLWNHGGKWVVYFILYLAIVMLVWKLIMQTRGRHWKDHDD